MRRTEPDMEQQRAPDAGGDHLHELPRRDDDGHDVPATLRPEEVWELMLRTVEQLMRTFADEMKTEGFLFSWYDVLIQLHTAPGQRMRMQDLSEAVVLSRSGLTRLIDRMEKKGLVARTAVDGDLRGTYAVLTDAGRASFDRYAPKHRENLHRHFSRHLDEADLAGLYGALTKIRLANMPDTTDLGRRSG